MSSSRTVTPAASRDLRLLALGIAALGGLVLTVAILAFGTALAALVTGAGWHPPTPRDWPALAGSLIVDPGLPDRLPAPWGPALAGLPALTWIAIGTLAIVVTADLIAVGYPAWRAFGPMPSGHATRADIRQELSPSAARRTARWTRPGLTAAERRRAPLPEIGVPQHRSPYGSPLWAPLENPSGSLAPTRYGKTRMDLVHKVLSAPGALLASTTKPDLLEFAALARSRRTQAGPVLVFDATGTTDWPAQLRWSPIEGCTDPAIARRRAEAMVEGASIDLSEVGGNDKVFRDRARTVLQTYLLAAAHHRFGVEALVRWSISRDDEPVTLLMAVYPEFARNLRQEIGMVAETSDAVWMSVRRTLEPLMDPTLRTLCTPPAGQEFDTRAFLRAHGSLFVIAGEDHAAQAAPILTAFAEHWITTAQTMALEQHHRRLDPPATALLDEVTHATPVPKLPDFIADSAGRGVLIHWAAQSVAKLEDTFGRSGARQLLDNTSCLTIFGGLRDKATLEWISVIAGHHERERYQHHSEGMVGIGRASMGTETAPVYRAGDIRTITTGRALLIHRNLAPINVRLLDVEARGDWPTLRTDRDTIRTGKVPLRSDGYRTDLEHHHTTAHPTSAEGRDTL